MSVLLLSSYILLWGLVICLSFFLLGALRALGLLNWRMDQLRATMPRRVGREGLKRGAKAPDFLLPDIEGAERTFYDFADRKLLLVFTQTGCSPCHAILPELNRLQSQRRIDILMVVNGVLEACRKWVAEARPSFPVLIQSDWKISHQYKIFATPFAFLINDQKVILSKGTIGTRQYLDYVLSGVSDGSLSEQTESESVANADENGNKSVAKERRLVNVEAD